MSDIKEKLHSPNHCLVADLKVLSLGLLLFIVLINNVGFDDKNIDLGEIITRKRRIRDFNQIHRKYVDDLAVAEVVNMKTEASKVFNQLFETEAHAKKNGMKVKYDKTKLILFHPDYSRDFMPKFTMNNDEIERVKETKLRGVVVRNDLSWPSNTGYIVNHLF